MHFPDGLQPSKSANRWQWLWTRKRANWRFSARNKSPWAHTEMTISRKASSTRHVLLCGQFAKCQWWSWLLMHLLHRVRKQTYWMLRQKSSDSERHCSNPSKLTNKRHSNSAKKKTLLFPKLNLRKLKKCNSWKKKASLFLRFKWKKNKRFNCKSWFRMPRNKLSCYS